MALLDPSASNVDPIPFAKVTLAKLVGKAGAMAWSGSAYRITYQAEDGMVSESFAPNGISMDDRAVLSPKALSPRGALFDDASQRLVVVGQDAGGALYLVSQGKDGISTPVLVGGGANSRDVHFFAEGAGYRLFWLGKSGNFEQVFSNLVTCP